MAHRPAPLHNLVTGRSVSDQYQSLTPRTPHSRAGRAEEAVDELRLDNGDSEYRTYQQQQAEPLLRSSASDSFPPTGYRGRGDDENRGIEKKATNDFLARIPLYTGCTIAASIFVLFLLSVYRPATIAWVIGDQDAYASQGSSTPVPSQEATVSDATKYIFYENYTQFPLLPTEYAAECSKLMHGFMTHSGTYWNSSTLDVPHHDDHTNYHLPEGERTEVCSKTLTYMLDGHVGLLADLALMAQAAGLAREQNRTFLIDDRYWNRGRWTDHFQHVRARQPGPEPGCRAPPPEELVACPRSARHWVLNSRTAKYHLGHPFSEEYEDPYARNLNRLKLIFTRALASFQETIRPNAYTAALIRASRNEMTTYTPPSIKSTLSSTSRNTTEGYIAVHIRRGDRHAHSWQYINSYVPLSDYVQATLSTSTRLNLTSPFPVYVASDSREAYEDFRTSLAVDTPVFSLWNSENKDLPPLANWKEYVQAEFDRMGEDERKRLTTGMIVDFAMVSGVWSWEGDVVPAATVCTLSSNVCKLAAVGLGWDRAFGSVDSDSGEIDEDGKRWVEIDLKGTVVPYWTAFELFN
ncbi:hypothetical protein NEOLEDRAFT_1110503 [Neolentinus lepideus HHB14362 ss-1]|uniref:Glycosyltransferase family 23 protein n=1 Tax=Neolentinus lepideus HHB14362 ss-1 TaxID=1314782 RepID=A0A165U5J6_9AGAM|nr:hypothetical protein NEOLEDRAFT_1110503 [Neolentinus lepideus HHB14362 ss-1]